MGSKFFDIPFLTRSSDSDFACKDGELELTSTDSILPSRGLPPKPEVNFALCRTTLAGWHIHPDVYPTKSVVASEATLNCWTPLASQLLAQLQSDATFQHKFVSPVFVTAAWKSVSGIYLSTSDPVLIIPNSMVPLVALDSDILREEAELKIAGAVGSLYMQLRAPEYLRDFVGIIDSLEILVSEPLQKYDSLIAFLPSKRVTTDSFCESLDPATGAISRERICTEILLLAWRAAVSGLTDFDSTEGCTDRKFYPFASIPLSEVDLADKWTEVSENSRIIRMSNGIAAGKSYQEILKDSSAPSKSRNYIVEGDGSVIDVMTRPLKLNGAGEFKRVRKVYVRGRFDSSNLTVTVYGARDLNHWWLIGKRKGGTTVLLPDSSHRFYRVGISGLLKTGENLQGLVFV